MTITTKPSAMGDAALLATTGSVHSARRLALELRELALTGVEDVVPADSSVGVLFDPSSTETARVEGEILEVMSRLPTEEELARTGGDRRSGSEHHVPVRFEGADIDEVAATISWSTADVVSRLCEATLEVGWLGFLPGFAYLTGLPAELAAIDRLDRPRTTVPPGAVAIGGGYAGIYPGSSPGGWRVLGSTSFRLFDADQPPFAVLAPGDAVRFLDDSSGSIREDMRGDFAAATTGPRRSGRRPPFAAATARALVVTAGGALTTVQDRGRIGVAHLGVPRAGAFDARLLALANLAVGNEPFAPALEIAAGGFTASCRGGAAVAVAGGAPLLLGGRPLPHGAVELVPDGARLEVGANQRGARTYLAVSGGVRCPEYFGSCSTDLISFIGPGPLQPGDELGLGPEGRPRGRFSTGPDIGALSHLRVVGAGRACSAVASRRWRVERTSDRTGVRLGPADDRPDVEPGHRVRSHALVTGAVQLPADGHPIILGPDHGTVGGYEVACTVVTADVPVLAQLGPGDEVELEPVSLDEASAALRKRWADTRDAVTGWLPSLPA